MIEQSNDTMDNKSNTVMDIKSDPMYLGSNYISPTKPWFFAIANLREMPVFDNSDWLEDFDPYRMEEDAPRLPDYLSSLPDPPAPETCPFEAFLDEFVGSPEPGPAYEDDVERDGEPGPEGKPEDEPASPNLLLKPGSPGCPAVSDEVDANQILILDFIMLSS